jgi:hypothetical protein
VRFFVEGTPIYVLMRDNFDHLRPVVGAVRSGTRIGLVSRLMLVTEDARSFGEDV